MRKITKKREILACKNCNKRSWHISRNGLCKKCLTAKISNANTQLKLKEGPIYDKWKTGMMTSLGIEI